MKTLLALCLSSLFALGVAGCGKKGPLEPPTGPTGQLTAPTAAPQHG